MTYILDAYALIAFIERENGHDHIYSILNQANKNECKVIVNVINFTEVYYDIYRSHGKLYADKLLENFTKLSIKVITEISFFVISEVGRIKATYGRMSLADTFLLAQAKENNAMIVTADHHELDKIEQSNEGLTFLWIR